jgi:hypothetical protein
VFRRLLVFLLHPIPSSDFPVTCQDDCWFLSSVPVFHSQLFFFVL